MKGAERLRWRDTRTNDELTEKVRPFVACRWFDIIANVRVGVADDSPAWVSAVNVKAGAS
jgi:hypothetical protein